MSEPISFTFYSPNDEAIFVILEKRLPAPQSQAYYLWQLTGQIQSTQDASTALGLGTSSSFSTWIYDQQGQTNEFYESLYNFNGLETGENMPPEGVLAIVMSGYNGMWDVPPGQDSMVIKGLINTLNCSGAYFGAVGTGNMTYYADQTIPAKVDVTYTLPPQ